MTAAAHQSGRRLALIVALLCLAAMVGPVASARATTSAAASATTAATTDWWVLLERASTAIRTTPFTAEALWVTWLDGQSHVTRSSVRNDPGGELVVGSEDGTIVRIGRDSAGLADGEASWILAVPAGAAADPREALKALEAKYEVAAPKPERVMDRPCVRLDIRRRSDGSLRERLWLDEETGLEFRRETYDVHGHPVRLIAYLSLDLAGAPGTAGRGLVRITKPTQPRRQDASEVQPAGLEALKAAGWTLPEALPGGYEPIGMYVLSSGEAQPLQITYSDGLYTVSVFQQPGDVDWASLRPGAEQVADLGWRAYHWPGAFPATIVWEADGRTYAVVGDAPADDLRAIAQAIPRSRPPSFVVRLGRGIHRLWSWMSFWRSRHF